MIYSYLTVATHPALLMWAARMLKDTHTHTHADKHRQVLDKHMRIWIHTCTKKYTNDPIPFMEVNTQDFIFIQMFRNTQNPYTQSHIHSINGAMQHQNIFLGCVCVCLCVCFQVILIYTVLSLTSDVMGDTRKKTLTWDMSKFTKCACLCVCSVLKGTSESFRPSLI